MGSGWATILVTANPQPKNIMELALLVLPPVAAIGFSILYLIFGGGLFGAVVIYIIAKLLGD